jgi:hypothetical protein
MPTRFLLLAVLPGRVVRQRLRISLRFANFLSDQIVAVREVDNGFALTDPTDIFLCRRART